MIIDTRDVMSGKMNGKTVWICHYNRPDLHKKPLRNIPPTKVVIRPLSELPKNKRVYYSESFFSPIGKNGRPLSRIISPVDNTGYRSYTGNTLFVFDNEKECKQEWNCQLKECMSLLDILIENAANHCKDEKRNIEAVVAQV